MPNTAAPNNRDDDDQDGFQFHELEYEYGVTDSWATSVTAGLIKEAQGSLIFDTLGWENTLQFTEQGKYWVDLGVHFEVELENESELHLCVCFLAIFR